MLKPILAAAAVSLMATATLAADVSGKLVLYTSQPNADAQTTVDAFTAKYPDVEVEWIRDGTTKVMAKLRAEFEAGAPQPDVLLIADMVTMEGLEAEGRLMPHPEADVSAYDPALMDDGKHYFSTKLITTGIVYNTSAPMVPTSYADLLTDPAKDKLAMPSPLTSGAATI
ncbi:MAG: extracellular solute-binding protein, partial [Pseudomonadota bacterium]